MALHVAALADFSDTFATNRLDEDYDIVVKSGSAEWDVDTAQGHLYQTAALDEDDWGWLRPAGVVLDAPGASWNMQLDTVPEWDSGRDWQDVGIQLQASADSQAFSIKLGLTWGNYWLSARRESLWSDRVSLGYADEEKPGWLKFPADAGDVMTLRYEGEQSGSHVYTFWRNARPLKGFQLMGTSGFDPPLAPPMLEIQSDVLLLYPVVVYWTPRTWRATIGRVWTEGVAAAAVRAAGRLAVAWGAMKAAK
jgi:hypothetical protein